MIETARFILRAFQQDDLDIITKLYSDEEVMRYIPLPIMNQELAQEHLKKVVDGWREVPQVNYEMAVIKKETNEKIGRAEITRNYREESAMIGWILLKSEWGKGCATELTNALTAYCFREWNVHRVYAQCHPDNIASWRVMEKCGMHREAYYIQKCKYVKAEGIRWEDELEYAVTRTATESKVV